MAFYERSFVFLRINFRANRSTIVALSNAHLRANNRSTVVFSSKRLFLFLVLLCQFSSTPSRLILDAGTEKLAGVLLISGKTRQVPSRRVTVGGRGSKGLFSPSISLPLSSPSFYTLPSLSSYLLVGDSTTSISDSGFTCGNPLTLRISLFSSFPFCILAFRRNLSIIKGCSVIIIFFLL